MKRRNIRSQAAMEFLMTYGWAILVVIISIAALSYYGVVDIGVSGVPNQCTLTPGLACIDFVIGSNSIYLVISNSLGEDVTITDIDLKYCDGAPVSEALYLKNGQRATYVIPDCNIVEKRYESQLNISFSGESGIAHKAVGKIVGKLSTLGSVNVGLIECNDNIDNDINGCADFDGGDTGCTSVDDDDEAGGVCPGAGGETSPLNCYVSSAANCQGAAIFKLSGLSDAHAETPVSSNFNFRVCCRSAVDTVSNSCPGESIPLHLSSATDAHVEKNTQSSYNVNVCMSADTGTISCDYISGIGDGHVLCISAGYNTCLATMSLDSDSHAGDCVTQPFSIKICCRRA